MGLVDELRLQFYPLVLGTGDRLFGGDAGQDPAASGRIASIRGRCGERDLCTPGVDAVCGPTIDSLRSRAVLGRSKGRMRSPPRQRFRSFRPLWGRPGESSCLLAAKTSANRPFSTCCGISRGRAGSRRSSVPNQATKDADLQGAFYGSDGLEPATSGVTGRYGATGHSRLRPGITGCSRDFRDARTGCDRLRPADGPAGLVWQVCGGSGVCLGN
jgi:hypothetical protein